MKVPKRLPKSFAEALATAKRRGEVVLEVKMMRYRGGALFQGKTASDCDRKGACGAGCAA